MMNESDDVDETPLLIMGEECRVEVDERDFLLDDTRKRPSFLRRCLCMLCFKCCRDNVPESRAIPLAKRTLDYYPPNVIRNQKYSVVFFIPCVLINQFKFFLNLYFLILAVTQFFPAVRVGYLYTYWGPLGFVLLVTLCREAVDDFRRYRRDKEINGQVYTKLVSTGQTTVTSAEIKVGDLLYIHKNQRLPADLILLRTTERSGACFIRTDQLDGETDWKLRLPVTALQKLSHDDDVFHVDAVVSAEPPKQDIHSFLGTFTLRNPDGTVEEESLSLENTMWANTVLASGSALCMVVYTGKETRSTMNNSSPRSKVGLVDLEINFLTKILFGTMITMSLVMVLLKGNRAYWYQYLVRFVLLFSYIIPLSLRVNLDMAKIFYSWSIMRDKYMPGNVVRSTTIPEELGRVGYVLTDKTGTLTKNEMIMKKFHVSSDGYSPESFHDLADMVRKSTAKKLVDLNGKPIETGGDSRLERARSRKAALLCEAVKAVALCHNVTPIDEEDEDGDGSKSRTYQAASPDEVALVQWTEEVGLSLTSRDLTHMSIMDPWGQQHHYEILMVFPFTSDTKRMGIILRDEETDKITFYLKGADVVMVEIIHYCDWLEEVVDMMANEGLRTLVVASKTLTKKQYQEFEAKYKSANLALAQRAARVASVVETLERDMELLCVTGVEDSLQDNVKGTLELMKNAGLKIWMLTGDKLETAASIAKSSYLVGRDQGIYLFRDVNDRNEAHLELNAFRRKDKSALVITGKSFEVCRQFYEEDLMELACRAPAVVVCRCAPTQKSEVVALVKRHSGKRTVAVGDGGNDVPMIQAADAGVGIVGKEGRQASLAADFSVTQFEHLGRLLLVHGRYSYLRTAALSQFIIHRGLIISVSQAVFSALFYYSSIALYHGILLIGYSTVYTNFPVFSLVLDKDVTDKVAMTYPELYKMLAKGRSLSLKTFLIWAIVSLYQGSVILYGTLILFENDFIHVVLLSFSALVLTELLMIVLMVKTWHYLMVVAELLSIGIYIASIFMFPKVFDFQFMGSAAFYWKVATITAIACVPLFIAKYLRTRFAPPAVAKLS